VTPSAPDDSEGLSGGEKVPGYLGEKDIPQDSATETFCALRFSIENSRWSGVPFYMRSGKRLARRVSEIAIQFKQPKSGLFAGDARYDLAPNRLVIQIQPDEGDDARPQLQGAGSRARARSRSAELPLRHNLRFQHARSV
jgi:glucose-6-phosphate 1-dehydrogenase